jgi:hypothetical protein
MNLGPQLDNTTVAERLEEIAELLEAQHANPYRVRSYRVAAETIRDLPEDVDSLIEKSGREGLLALPGIGSSLARSIEGLAHTGHLALLGRLRGDVKTEDVLTTVPTIGPELAARVHDQLGIESLPELEAAAYDGRLDRVPGFGRGRLLAVRESLAGRLRRRHTDPRLHVQHRNPEDEPDVSELLDVDREYERKVRADRLPRIAPRRFNPTHQAWLSILHTGRGHRHYTALYSNTARAHELGTTRDWVVIYRDDHHGDGQWTVVTSRFGPLTGQRIVRGRESECLRHYASKDPTGKKRSASGSPSG